MGPLDLAAGLDPSMDIRPHPHIGLATVTYLFSGEVMHRDSLGYEKDRLAQAAADWRAGRMRLPDADDEAFTPLPDEPLPLFSTRTT